MIQVSNIIKYRKTVFKSILVSLIILALAFLVLTNLFRSAAIDKVYDIQYSEYLNAMSVYKKDLSEYESEYNRLLSNKKAEIIEAENETGYGRFKVNINVTCDYNNSVGQDWRYSTYINDSLIKNSDIIICPLDENSTFYTKCIENDSIPDFATRTFSYRIEDGLCLEFSIINTENRGRYSGNTAKHTFTYSFSRYVDETVALAAIKNQLSNKPVEPNEPLRGNIKLSPLQIAEQKSLIWVLLAVLVVWRVFRLNISIEAQMQHEQDLIKAEQERQEQKRIEEQRKAEFLAEYDNKNIDDILKMVGAPEGATIDDAGLPSKYVDGVNIYEVYYSANGAKYHTKNCRYSSSCKKHNLVYASKKTPCTLCKPIRDDLCWYRKYREILRLKKKYENQK